MKASIRCAKCGHKAKSLYSPDVDVRPIGACKRHQDDVNIAYFALYHLGSDCWKDVTRGWWINKAVARRVTKAKETK